MIVPGTSLGFAVAVAGKPEPNADRAFEAAYQAVVEAVCKVVAVGATPLGLTDCLNFGNPRKEDHYSQFVAAVEGLRKAALDFELPFVSGNVSFYNESAEGKAIPASAIVGCAGALQDVSKTITPAFKEAGSTIYAATPDAIPHIGGAMAKGTVRACSVTFDGGVIAAVVKLANGSQEAGLTIGARIDAPSLAGEIAFVVEGDNALERIPGVQKIGQTIDSPSLILGDREYPLNVLFEQWSEPLAEVYA